MFWVLLKNMYSTIIRWGILCILIRLNWLAVLLKFTTYSLTSYPCSIDYWKMGVVIYYYNCGLIYFFLQFYYFFATYALKLFLLGIYLFKIVMNLSPFHFEITILILEMFCGLKYTLSYINIAILAFILLVWV